ncbi:Peptidyl-prolyl cis-trans isomerase H [Portunus trituberculatus]|uniref:Peptidyl-prolyl cis-trans isomerase n=1 Tax=Portunus trituberculatus TaxID=210409 RepID=A0A5B7CXV9_PORTR|nr:Peptidyl-prolyl cis-trans isomerase H [Portunus trituberculatus]
MKSQSTVLRKVNCFEISLVPEREIGRMIMELYSDVCPKTSENFRQFCTGEYRKDGVPIGYKGASFHRVIKDFMIQGGDFVRGDGTGTQSIYGPSFPDENFLLKHDGPGLLSLANSGKDTNGCQFFITCAKCDFLDGKHVVFGRVIEGLLVMRKIENVPTGPNNKPKIPVVISQCGQMRLNESLNFWKISTNSLSGGGLARMDSNPSPMSFFLDFRDLKHEHQ